MRSNRVVYGWVILFVLLGFSSCKTTRVVTTLPGVVRPLSIGKLIHNVESNDFDYKYLSIKKIVCQFDNGKTKTSFRANIQAQKDKLITVNLTKLNIPVGRLWLTPDSVKFINYMEENYFLDDYSYLSSLMDMNLDFQTVHAIISNNVFSLRDPRNDSEIRNSMAPIEDGMYVLESVRTPKSEKVKARVQSKRQPRGSKNIVAGAPVTQRLYVDPLTFKLRKIILNDELNARSVNIDFSDFVEVGKQLYPGQIALHLQSPDSNMEMDIKLSNFSLQEEKAIRFKVPEKYTRVGHE